MVKIETHWSKVGVQCKTTQSLMNISFLIPFKYTKSSALRIVPLINCQKSTLENKFLLTGLIPLHYPVWSSYLFISLGFPLPSRGLSSEVLLAFYLCHWVKDVIKHGQFEDDRRCSDLIVHLPEGTLWYQGLLWLEVISSDYESYQGASLLGSYFPKSCND